MEDIFTASLTTVNTVVLGYLVWSANHSRGKLKNQMVMDTSGLIDGRILDIVESGFVPQRLIIPQFVVAELQFLADQGDSFKRERARYGLDVVRKLQDMRQTEVVIRPGMAKGIKEVDDKLVALAKKTGAMLYTTDFNLNQVAQIEGVRVLNVNELAQGLRAMHLPGEKSEIKITQVGQDKSQGVGYLEDGTMVVVEQAGNRIGQKVQVEFSRMLQTQAGKMMFATLRGEHSQPNQQRKPNLAAQPTQRPTKPAETQTAEAPPIKQQQAKSQNNNGAQRQNRRRSHSQQSTNHSGLTLH